MIEATLANLHDVITGKRLAAEYAQREREIRADLIEDVTDAIRTESERIGQTVGWSGDVDEALATVAVDAVADYYRRAAKLLG